LCARCGGSAYDGSANKPNSEQCGSTCRTQRGEAVVLMGAMESHAGDRVLFPWIDDCAEGFTIGARHSRVTIARRAARGVSERGAVCFTNHGDHTKACNHPRVPVMMIGPRLAGSVIPANRRRPRREAVEFFAER